MPLQDRIDELDRQQRLAGTEGLLLHAAVKSYVAHGTPTAGVNGVYHVLLDGNHEAFHKPFAGVAVATAQMYQQDPDSVPLNECEAWRLARGLGGIVEEVVAPCVLRSFRGEAGSLSSRRYGISKTMEPFLHAPAQCRAAAFFDSLIAQEDRHIGNYRWSTGDHLLVVVPGNTFRDC